MPKVNHFLHYFIILLHLTSSFSLTKFFLVPYAYVSIKSIDCFLLLLFEHKSILLNLCCAFNIVFFVWILYVLFKTLRPTLYCKIFAELNLIEPNLVKMRHLWDLNKFQFIHKISLVRFKRFLRISSKNDYQITVHLQIISIKLLYLSFIFCLMVYFIFKMSCF